jgi:hypothetical protein
MLAVLLALAAAVGYGGSDYAAGLAARRASVVRVTVLVEATSVVLLACVVPFLGSRAPDLASVLWGAGAGVCGVAGAMALYLGFRAAAFSVASSVSAVGTAAFSVLAGLVLGERPGALSLAGICFALPAIVAVSAPAGKPGPPVQHGAAPPGQHGRGPETEERGPRPSGDSRGAAPPGQHGRGPVTEERGLRPSGGSRGVAPPGQQSPVTKERGLKASGGFRGVVPPGQHGQHLGWPATRPRWHCSAWATSSACCSSPPTR